MKPDDPQNPALKLYFRQLQVHCSVPMMCVANFSCLGNSWLNFKTPLISIFPLCIEEWCLSRMALKNEYIYSNGLCLCVSVQFNDDHAEAGD